VILYPAIDLKGGACVRLRRGRMDEATRYNADPAAQARLFADAGAEWLHLVDLDGAIEGRQANGEAVEAILRAVAIPCQLGGGVRDEAAVERWLEHGIARVILGTAAVENEELVRRACRRHPGRIAVAIDARAGLVAVKGWVETTAIAALDLARRLADAGVAALLYTDIDRDGVLTGVNIGATAALARVSGCPVIASGGVASLDDLTALKAEEASGIAGVICGRAIYEGLVDLGEAIRLLRGAPC
jgi:phosphoribosylformimino-5-aminoimidazole carboxamide ribotide isomerase